MNAVPGGPLPKDWRDGNELGFTATKPNKSRQHTECTWEDEGQEVRGLEQHGVLGWWVVSSKYLCLASSDTSIGLLAVNHKDGRAIGRGIAAKR